jgi:plasmid stabilization system protein ParE
MQVLWTHAARQDLVDIGDYIALRSPEAAARFVAELLDRTKVLRTAPFAGRIVPELGREDIRELIHGIYRIVYRRTSGAVQILTVFEGHRLFDADGIDL